MELQYFGFIGKECLPFSARKGVFPCGLLVGLNHIPFVLSKILGKNATQTLSQSITGIRVKIRAAQGAKKM
jgi:hypothetical protein